jgi:hypothetical protein
VGTRVKDSRNKQNTAKLIAAQRRNFQEESFRFVSAGTRLQIAPAPRARKLNKKRLFRRFLVFQKPSGARSVQPKKPKKPIAQHIIPPKPNTAETNKTVRVCIPVNFRVPVNYLSKNLPESSSFSQSLFHPILLLFYLGYT